MSGVSVDSKLLSDNISLVIQLLFAIWKATSVILEKTHLYFQDNTLFSRFSLIKPFPCTFNYYCELETLMQNLKMWTVNEDISCQSQKVCQTYCDMFFCNTCSVRVIAAGVICAPLVLLQLSCSSQSLSVLQRCSTHLSDRFIKSKNSNNVSVQGKTSRHETILPPWRETKKQFLWSYCSWK